MVKKIIGGILFALFCIAIICISVFVGKFLYSIYDNQIQIVDKDTQELNMEIEKEEIILPDISSPDIEIEDIEDIEGIRTEDNIYKEEQKKEEILNIVLVGMDTRSDNYNSRSDSIILLSYNKDRHILKMVSFLRDTWVYLPGKGYSRINNATAYGGVGLLINTLNENLDLDIQNYVQVRFEDFKKIIDIMGGLDVELSKSEINYINNKLHTDDKDWNNDITDSPGVIHLNGVQTLWHCRNRTIGEGDFSRTDRQREVLQLIVNKMMSLSKIEVTKLLYDMKDSVNMNIPLDNVLSIASDALIFRNIEIESYRIPFENMYHYANKNGASVLEINMDKTVIELHKILGISEDVSEVSSEEVK